MMIMSLAVKIAAGYLLDLFFGDPYSFPHPVRYIGKLIGYLESVLRKLGRDKLAGILLTLITVSITFVITYYLSAVSIIIEIIIIYTVFSVRCLADEAGAVYRALENSDIAEARKRVSCLVSRDTAKLDEKAVIRATVETVSENIVDGIISPMFYLFIGGAPLGMAYKAASTLDSMVGYKNAKYIMFGWAGARLDDLLNFIPARLTAFIILPAAAFVCGMSAKNAFRIMLRDRLKHSSPNSAHAESAVAGAIGCRLGGPSEYFGEVIDKPYIGDAAKETGMEDILKSIKLMYVSSVIGLLLGCIMAVTAALICRNI
ncbi:MAG: cobalamin biosynthesis protein CobD [Spirochaetes bacterium]|nr:cobalamin biosynthesis protein CobD [Spirochaetota bacterium]